MALYDFRQDGSKLQLYKKGSSMLCYEFDFGGGTDKDEQTLTINGSDLTISNGNTVTLPSETLTSLIANGTQYDYTAEDGTISFVVAATFISGDSGNAIAIGSDNGLMLSIPAQLPDDQLLSGDNTGTVQITLTPVPQPDGSINYLIKADLPIALATPNGNQNALKLDANGKWYVEPETLTALALAGTTLNYTDENGVVTSITLPSGGGTADGSETKVNAGTNVTITGAGTTASPYVINAANNQTLTLTGNTLSISNGNNVTLPVADARLADIGSAMNATLGSNQTYGGRSFAQWNFGFTINQIGNSSLITRNANGTFTLAAGYRYEVYLRIQVRSGSQWTAYRLQANGANLYNRIYMGSGFNGASSVNGREHSASYAFNVTTPTTLSVNNWEGDSASSWTFDSHTDIAIKVIGII